MQFKRAAALGVVAVLLCAPSFAATHAMVRSMSLGEISDGADKVFRGKVLSIREGSIQAGGAELPTVTYSLLVADEFKGDYAMRKGDDTYVEITMLGSGKPSEIDGAIRVPVLPELPQLKVGEGYLLMTTRPSAIGLSTTVGLQQGCFHIDAKTGMASNGAGWEPVAYSALATELRATLGQ